jgi:hypothetical protein
MIQPENDKKGKINLKDYCFELDSDHDEQKVVIKKPPANINKSNAKNTSNIGR